MKCRGRHRPGVDPLQPFGDTPTGSYRIANIVANGAGTTRTVAQYGKSGADVLDPTGGVILP